VITDVHLDEGVSQEDKKMNYDEYQESKMEEERLQKIIQKEREQYAEELAIENETEEMKARERLEEESRVERRKVFD